MELTRHTPCSSFWQDWCTQQAARKESVGGREEGERKTLEIWTSSQRGQHGNHELPRRRPESEENGQGHLPRKHPHCGMSGSHSASTDPLTTITFPVKRNYQHFADEEAEWGQGAGRSERGSTGFKPRSRRAPGARSHCLVRAFQEAPEAAGQELLSRPGGHSGLGRTVPRSHQRRTRLQWTEELLGGRRKFKAGRVNL